MKQITLAIAAVAVSTAASAQQLTLEVGRAEAISTDRGARAIVVGNPLVVSANAITDQLVVVTPKVDGSTNLILYDEEGREILRRDILVGSPEPPPASPRAPRSVIKITPGFVQELACGPFCLYKAPPAQLIVSTPNGNVATQAPLLAPQNGDRR
jgi:Flp pilus assembly secretin CpaC